MHPPVPPSLPSSTAREPLEPQSCGFPTRLCVPRLVQQQSHFSLGRTLPMKSSRKPNFNKAAAGPCGTRAKIHNVACFANLLLLTGTGRSPRTCSDPERHTGTQPSAGPQMGIGIQHTTKSPSKDSSQVKSQGFPNCSLTSSTTAASLSIFSSSSFLWEMSFIRDVDVSMASCSFLWKMRAGRHQQAQRQLPATCKATLLLLELGLSWRCRSSAPKGAPLHHSSPAEGSVMEWSRSSCFTLSCVSHCRRAHGTAAGV